ncbi:MAG TPA: hypothetical protein DD618_00820 [Acholeplasmatales bacterium]|nr:hypothetical protein [Acholeplasmatales bacterium]
MKKETPLILNVLFYGALWGFLEATLGYGLKFLPPLVSGSVMFPIGAAIMLYAYQKTQSKKAILYVGLIAASIKAVDFMLPGLPTIMTYNPMISIVLQSLAVFSLLPLLKHQKALVRVSAFVIPGLLWRIFFLGNQGLNIFLFGEVYKQIQSLENMIDFTILPGLLDGAVFAGLYLGSRAIFKKTTWLFRPNWAVSAAMFIMAIAATLLI